MAFQNLPPDEFQYSLTNSTLWESCSLQLSNTVKMWTHPDFAKFVQRVMIRFDNLCSSRLINEMYPNK